MVLGAGRGPFTRGFRTEFLWKRHARLHGAEVGASDRYHYLALADNFLGGPLGENVRECVRVFDQARVRWNAVTQEYGILSADGFIQSYYILDLAWHTYPSNRAYFEADCNR